MHKFAAYIALPKGNFFKEILRKIEFEFMQQNSNSIFPLSRLKIFLAGFLENVAFNALDVSIFLSRIGPQTLQIIKKSSLQSTI